MHGAASRPATPQQIAVKTARALGTMTGPRMDAVPAPAHDNVERLWDTDEVAGFLNVSVSWVMKNRDRIPHVKLGRRILHEPNRIREFVRACAA